MAVTQPSLARTGETGRVGPRREQALALLRQDAPSASALKAAGFDTLDDVANFVAAQLNLPRMELDGEELPAELGRLVSRSMCERKRFVPTFASPGELTIATADPTRLELFDGLSGELHRSIITVVATWPEIDRAIKRLYESLQVVEERRGEETVSREEIEEATSVADRLIAQAVEMRASDIHIEALEKETAVRFRIDGALRLIETLPASAHAGLVSRIKVMSQLDISERQSPQDGRIKLRRAKGDIDLRVSVLPTYFGEKVCCRILDNSRACLPLTELGFDQEQLVAFNKLIRSPWGMVLVTGPTGSGKSMTLYGALNAVKSPELNVVTVEDPVEYQLVGINQVPVNPKRGMTFAAALRSILRQDPNVILVGEIRDPETGQIASEAALTGHLVLSSLHTNDAPSAITRLTEMGIEPFLVAPALIGVIAQRLIRRVCEGCKEPYEPTAEELEGLGLPRLPPGVKLHRGKGCELCNRTGYKGRTAIREILVVDEAMKARIGKGATAEELRADAVAGGFKPMRHQALKRLFGGITTTQEVLRVTR